MTRQEQYFAKHPIIEIYKGYEIRDGGVDPYGYKSFICDAAIASYSITSSHIKGCREFIDKLVNLGIKQYDNEAVSKYIFNRKRNEY